VSELRQTALFEQHVEAGARIVPFAGWQMPVQYVGVRQEHDAVRSSAGMFDVSHMGQVRVQGAQAEDFLQKALSNDVSLVAVQGAQYNLLCNESGGVLDDLFIYRLDSDQYLLITNAANHQRDFDWLLQCSKEFAVEVTDVAEEYAMIAVQGPLARKTVKSLCDSELPVRMTVSTVKIANTDALICGTGYTGEDGVEILVDPSVAPQLWAELAAKGVTPVGLGARDTLRLEVCYHLYGNDLDEQTSPIEAGLGWCCKEETGFIGAAEVSKVREQGPKKRLVAFEMSGKGIARGGNPVVGSGRVTSGTMSPSIGVGIGMAYVPTELSQPGTPIEIDVRGKLRSAVVKEKPLYRKGA